MISQKIRPMIIFSEFFGEKRYRKCTGQLHTYLLSLVWPIVNGITQTTFILKLHNRKLFRQVVLKVFIYKHIGSQLRAILLESVGNSISISEWEVEVHQHNSVIPSYPGSQRWIVWFYASVAQIQRTDLICICTLHGSIIDIIQNPIAFPILFSFQ